MVRRVLRHPALYYIVPALLVLIACLQLYRAHTQHLTPWKGGGFGMFSTVDAPGTRILRTYLITPEGEALALYGTLSIQTTRVLAMPDTPTLEQVARETAATSWVVSTFSQTLDALASLPEGLRLYLARSPEMARRHRVRRHERLLAAADSSGAGIEDSTLLAVDTTAIASYPALIAFAQPRGVPSAGPEVEGVRVEVWGLRFDQALKRAAPELLNSVTLDL